MARTAVILPLALFFFLAGCTSVFFSPAEKKHFVNPFVPRFSPRDVYFPTSDGLTLHGWFFAAKQPGRPAMLVLHGNAENVSTHVNTVLWLVEEGFNVFIIDYRGYGKSEGRTTAAGIHLDAEAALEALLRMPGIDPDRIILLGQSLGGAVAVYTAAYSPARQHIKAVIIDSAFAGYRRIAREKIGSCACAWPFQYPLSLLINNEYSPERWIAQVSPIPVLILHSEHDPVVPFSHAQILFDAARPPKELWETGMQGHIRSFASKEIREKLVRHYLSGLGLTNGKK